MHVRGGEKQMHGAAIREQESPSPPVCPLGPKHAQAGMRIRTGTTGSRISPYCFWRDDMNSRPDRK